jgi:hypothetical protein
MITMRERTRRQWCLAGFVSLCLLPTLGVAAFCIARNLPGHAQAEAAQLSRLLGVGVSFDSYARTRPGAVRYDGLVLTDPETGIALAECQRLDAAWQTVKDDKGQRRAMLMLTATAPRLAAAGLARLWRLPDRALLGEPGAADCDVRLAADEARIGGAAGEHELTDVQAALDTLSSGSQAQVCFRVRGVEMSEPARVRIVRNRQLSPPANGLELDTRGAALPCSLLAIGFGPMNDMGTDSRFRGYVWRNGSPGDAHVELTGQLYGVDLGRLIDQHLPYRFTGRADVAVQAARFHGQRLAEASFAVNAGPGVFSRSLFDAMVDRLKLVRCAEPPFGGDLVSYRQLAFSAVLDGNGLRLQGLCESTVQGTVLASERGVLLSEPILQPQPVAAVIQTLAPGIETTLPMTREAEWLARRLPAPQPATPPLDAALDSPRLRFGRSIH